MATVELTCNLSSECQGAFVMCLPGGDLCQTGPTEDGAGGRVAGSDFSIPPGSTGQVAVALTDLGQQVVSGPSGFSAGVIVDLLNYGSVINTTGSDTGSFSLTSTDPPSFPSGATAGCGGTVFVGPDTSCPFAENVQRAYLNSVDQGNGGTVTAVSPVTGQTYTMQCTDGSPVVCTGGTNAVVEFYR
jgi:serine/threonine kinase PknH